MKQRILFAVVIALLLSAIKVFGQDKKEVIPDSTKNKIKIEVLDEQLDGLQKQYDQLTQKEVELKASLQEIADMKRSLLAQAGTINDTKKKLNPPKKKPE